MRPIPAFLSLLLTAGIAGPLSAEEESLSGFTEVSREVGLADLGGGKAAWVDFDNDGWVDLYVANTLWQNQAGKGFIQVKDLPETMRGAGVWGDFDNSGFPDFYSYQHNRLFRNIEGQSFVEISHKLPATATTSSRGAVWGDFSGNGFLDLYIAGYEHWGRGITYPDLLLINREGKKFELAFTETRYRARGVTACDFNHNGNLDIYVSNYRLQPNLLLVNQGNAAFTETGKTLGVAGTNTSGAWGHTIGSAWGDFDNSGWFDLFVGNFSHPPAYQDRPKFLQNRGPQANFKFRDRSSQAKLHWQESYASPALADFDNDGWLDLFLTSVYQGDHSVLYRNLGNWEFSDFTTTSGIETARTYQAAWADYNNNGHLDLVSGGRLYRNSGSGNRWLKVRLIGRGPVNRSAIGAQARVKLGDQTISRQVEGATGEGNQNDLTLHFGLGQAEGPLELTVRWTNGTEQSKTVSQLNRLVEIEYQEPENPVPEQPGL